MGAPRGWYVRRRRARGDVRRVRHRGAADRSGGRRIRAARTSPAGRRPCSTASSPCPRGRGARWTRSRSTSPTRRRRSSTSARHPSPFPGLMQGLEEAHERRGRLPWQTLFVPALELASRPFGTTDAQAFLHEILVPILQREDRWRRRSTAPSGSIDATALMPTLRLLQDMRGEGVAILLPELGDDIEALRGRGAHGRSKARFAGATVLSDAAPVVRRRGRAERARRARRGDAAQPRAPRAMRTALAGALAAGYASDGTPAEPSHRNDTCLRRRR